MEIASETLSLTWWQIILCKIIKNTSETRESLDRYDSEYMMNIFEYLSYEEYINALQIKNSKDTVTQKQKLGRMLKSFPN